MLAHLSPANTYTAGAYTGDVLRSVSQNKDVGTADGAALLVFGNGDGGGGPVPPMFERLRRIRAAANGFAKGHVGKVKLGDSVTDFYDILKKKSNNGKDLNTWYGELYFELHRGTYTSHGWTKRGNRKSEVLLREVEYASTLASIASKSFTYPKAELDPLWEMLLLCQFHDVLPGSAIEEANIEAREMYAKIEKEGSKLLENAMSVIMPNSQPLEAANVKSGGSIVGVNTTSWPRHEVVEIQLNNASRGSELANQVVQISSDGQKSYTLVQTEANAASAPLASKAAQLASIVNSGVCITKTGDNSVSIRNSRLNVSIDGGIITSLYDVDARRELIPNGAKANQFIMYEDQPLFWDAWDVELYHLQTGVPVGPGTLQVLDKGPLRASVQIRYQLSDKSWLKSVISLDAVPAGTSDSAVLSFLRFQNEVEWRESHKFLKVEFPVDIYSDTASYEVQFGVNKRPTHFNTSWDLARFEVCGHRFADLSEFGYGVALLSDCKYGYATHGNVMRLSLLRSPKSPDGHTDMGRHEFQYGLLPHKGSFNESDVVKAGYQFNVPLHLRYQQKVEAIGSAISVEGGRNVVIDTIKRGEDDKGSNQTVIVRLYEAYGGHAEVQLRTTLPVVSAHTTNILEDDKDKTPWCCEDLNVIRVQSKSEVIIPSIKFRGFQVVTVKLTLGESSMDEGWVHVNVK